LSAAGLLSSKGPLAVKRAALSSLFRSGAAIPSAIPPAFVDHDALDEAARGGAIAHPFQKTRIL